MKLKLKSSARRKDRYLLLEAKNKKEIEETILEYIGILGWAKASPKFIEGKSNKIILSVNRKELTNVRAAFEASDKKIKVLRVSGTLKGLEK